MDYLADVIIDKILFHKRLNMKRIITLLFLNLVFCFAGFAQERQIIGTITDGSNGEPVIGANIIVKGTTTGASSDVNGNYKLSVSEGTVLVVTFIGFDNYEFTVDARSVVDVELAPSSTELVELVFVGTRAAPRSSIDTPVPVDMISAKELTSTG